MNTSNRLTRELGVIGATFMGLGAMLGTGVFVSIGIAAGAGGPSVILAILVAALVALCNAMSSAQLAASHPVSGGAYEYGYLYLRPVAGFAAGWMFLCAKSASAASAALGASGYLVHAFGLDEMVDTRWPAAALVVLITLLVLGGMRRSNVTNIFIVSVTLLSLSAFVIAAAPAALAGGVAHFQPILPSDRTAVSGFLEACALMFVAYTGYGRIATLGEEVRDPRRIIPRAILVALGISALLYLAVGFAAIGAAGSAIFAASTGRFASPLESVLRGLGHPLTATLVAAGAITAMLGVLLNLILGLSRVALAMARRRDLPRQFAIVKNGNPRAAVVATGIFVIALTLVGDIRLTWSFSAFTVLVYYAINNLCALRLPVGDRLYPRAFAWAGLVACAFLAFWVEPRVWMIGLVVLSVGLAGHFARRAIG
jgi:APA family basic amino acid/polyamine antiporter